METRQRRELYNVSNNARLELAERCCSEKCEPRTESFPNELRRSSFSSRPPFEIHPQVLSSMDLSGLCLLDEAHVESETLIRAQELANHQISISWSFGVLLGLILTF